MIVKPENPFRQWLNARTRTGGWVPIAQNVPMGPLARPALAKTTDRATLLEIDEVPYQLDCAGPTVVTSLGDHQDEEIHSASFDRMKAKGAIVYRPIVAAFAPLHRAGWLEPVQEFVLYWSAWPDHEDDGRIVWRRQTDSGELEDIARWLPSGSASGERCLEVSRKHLVAFLSMFGFDLVVYYNEFVSNAHGLVDGWQDSGHDTGCKWDVNTVDVGGGETTTTINAIWVVWAPPLADTQQPGQHEQHEKIEYPRSTDPATGREICQAFTHERDYLLPIFFREEVLEKYYADPALYSVTDCTVECKWSWRLPIARTDRKTVHAWLGDVAHLPRDVQRHWRGYAEVDDGAVPPWRVARDFYVERIEVPDDTPLGRLRSSIKRANLAADRRLAHRLYDEVDPNQEQRIRVLRMPPNGSMRAFQEQLGALAIFTVDHINCKLFDSAGIPGGADAKPLARLATLVAQLTGIDEKGARQQLSGLLTIQTLRSRLSAHRTGKEADRALANAGIAKDRLQQGFATLCSAAATAIDSVTAALESSEQPPA